MRRAGFPEAYCWAGGSAAGLCSAGSACLELHDGRVWRRSIGETPEDFQSRVIEEARQGAQGRAVSLRPVFATEGD